jgi:glutathione S-transferase
MRLSLYRFEGCPYCAMVEHAAVRLGVDLPQRDIHLDPGARDELVAARGRPTVPVLRIEEGEGTRWLGESLDILDWLEARFGDGEGPRRGGLRMLTRLQPLLWVLLVAGGLLGGAWREPIWALATGVAALRSFALWRLSLTLHHLLVGGVFALATVSLSLSAAGVADFDWTGVALVVVVGLVASRLRV